VDHEQRVKLYEAILDAFALDMVGLTRMLVYRAKWSPGAIPNHAGQLPANVVFHVVEEARMAGTEDELLQAALDTKPRNPKLRALGEFVNFGGLTAPTGMVLEREVTLGLPNVPVAVWRERLGQIEGWVCRIEIPPTTREGEGTGFLIGPDLVVTARHVVEPVIAGTYKPTDIRVRFDYRATSAGTRVREGTVVGLNLTDGTAYPGAGGTMESSWLIDSARHSPVDVLVDPGGRLPDPSDLDFTVLRLADAIGRRPVNPMATNDPNEAPRGWVTTPTTEAGLTPPGSMFIVQHPRARPMELALGGNALIGLNGNRTRVRYRTNTEPGSSGSPVFDLNWNLIALHHAGDPNYALAYTPQWNQGIPFHLIAARLTNKGFGTLLNQRQ
jgi:hypothetical protein